MSGRFTTAVILIGCFAAGLLVAGKLREATEAGAQSTAGSSRTTPVTAPGPAGASGTLTDFTRIAERTIPAVVNVSAQQVVRRLVPNDPFFMLFGGDDFLGSRRGVENSLGSGVIVSNDGYILTNNHVVTGETARQITIEQLDVTVALADKREVPATVVGTDPATDLALLKISARDLPTMPWGDSSKLKVAEWVLAIGNPYQLNQTVTLGIVSALGRNNLGVSSYEDFIQTDAAINPGNSGGALINSRGELIGINTVIFSQSGGYQGIGFAVSSNLARRVVNDLQQYQEVRRGSIGPIQIVPLTTRIANELQLSDTKGALIYQVGRTSPAAKAGLQRADVVVSFNGTPVEDPGHLSRLVSDAKIGGTATLGVIRNGRRVDLKVDITRLSAR